MSSSRPGRSALKNRNPTPPCKKGITHGIAEGHPVAELTGQAREKQNGTGANVQQAHPQIVPFPVRTYRQAA